MHHCQPAPGMFNCFLPAERQRWRQWQWRSPAASGSHHFRPLAAEWRRQVVAARGVATAAAPSPSTQAGDDEAHANCTSSEPPSTVVSIAWKGSSSSMAAGDHAYNAWKTWGSVNWRVVHWLSLSCPPWHLSHLSQFVSQVHRSDYT